MTAHPPITEVRAAVERALAEDLTPLGDLTSSLLPPDLEAAADIVPRKAGVLAGRLCAAETFAAVDPRIAVEWHTDDGDELVAGKPAATVTGPLPSILTAERTALNFLGHLSGIATLTRRFAEAATPAKVWDTRKTTPGLRALEKAAVRAGGGVNHRGNLTDWVLLKDNHIALFGITEAVRRARERWPARTVEVECDTIDQLREAIEAGVDLAMLDNMTPEQVRECVALADGHDVLLEVSGGITLENVRRYGETGVDLVSSGAITNSAPVLDIGLDVSS